MKNIELLAPSGDYETLQFAIDAGADAVYIGGHKYSARSFSSNFSMEEITEAVKYAHLRRRLVYVAVNTLILANEFNDCINYCDQLYAAGVDAIIVQDYGLLNVAIDRYPDMEVHASTQMTIDSLEGVMHLESLGVDRVVLSREMSIADIKNIRKHTSIPLEIFVSGALCVSYSGQCLMSSLIGGRSGNRGTCSQNCRKKYTLLDSNGEQIKTEGQYLLSSRDLLVLDNLNEIIELDNVSLKIEGRMKRKEYVKKVVSIFRNKVDKKEVTKNDITELKSLFNRDFTQGHMFNDFSINQYRPNHVGVPLGRVVGNFKVRLTDTLNQGDGIRVIGKNEFGLYVNFMEKNGLLVSSAKAGDIVTIKTKYRASIGDTVVKTTDISLINELNKDSYYQKYDLDIVLSSEKNELIAKIELPNGEVVTYRKEMLEVSENDNSARIIKQLSKSGNFPFTIKITAKNVNSIFARSGDLNAFRREMVEAYTVELLKIDRTVNKTEYEKLDITQTNDLAITVLTEVQKLKVEALGYKPLSKIVDGTIPIQARAGTMNYSAESGIVSNYSGLVTYKEFSTNFSMNVTNHYSAYFLHKLGAEKVCLSLELNKEQIKDLYMSFQVVFRSKPNFEIICFGRPESMLIKHELQNNTTLKDELGYEYYITRDELTTIYHNNVINIIGRLTEIPQMNYRIDFVNESIAEVQMFIEDFDKKITKSKYFGHFDLGI